MTEKNEAFGGAALVEALHVGERQAHGPLAVFPLHVNGEAQAGGPRYVTLREALADHRARITEVSEGGSVPELRVVNKATRASWCSTARSCAAPSRTACSTPAS